MDLSVPASAAILLDFIGDTEAPQGYRTVYGNNQAKLPKPLTSMTVGEVIAAGPSWTKRFGSSACGRYQFMRATLQGLVKEGACSADEKLDDRLQDRLGLHLLRRRGFDKFVAGSLSVTGFGLNLAKEWASFPVLKACQGAKRRVARGQSYYAGDGLNKALVTPEEVEAVLARCLAVARAGAIEPKPAKPSATAPEMTSYVIKALQQQLNDLGYKMVGKIDGKLGPRTKAAVTAFQDVNELPLTGNFDPATLAKLNDKPKPMPLRPASSAKELAKEAPIVGETKQQEAAAGTATVVAGGVSVGAIISQILGYGTAVKEALGEVPLWAWAAIGLAVTAPMAFAWYRSRTIRGRRVDMHLYGETA